MKYKFGERFPFWYKNLTSGEVRGLLLWLWRVYGSGVTTDSFNPIYLVVQKLLCFKSFGHLERFVNLKYYGKTQGSNHPRILYFDF